MSAMGSEKIDLVTFFEIGNYVPPVSNEVKEEKGRTFFRFWNNSILIIEEGSLEEQMLAELNALPPSKTKNAGRW